MKIKLLAIGKTDNKNLQALIETYQGRLKHYINFQLEVIPDIKNAKNLSQQQQKEKEGELILKKLVPTDQLILLDEKGATFRSVEFSSFLQKKMNAGIKQLVLVIEIERIEKPRDLHEVFRVVIQGNRQPRLELSQHVLSAFQSVQFGSLAHVSIGAPWFTVQNP